MVSIRKLAGQTAIYGLSSIIGRLVVWGLTPVYTRYMLPDEYGIFSDLYSFITYFLVLLTFGLETSFFRYTNDDRSNTGPYNQSFIATFVMAALFLLLALSGYKLFASLLGHGDRPMLAVYVALITFLDVIVALPMAKLRFDERPGLFAAVSLFSIFLTIVLNLWFMLGSGHKSAEMVFLANLIASAAKTLLLFLCATSLTRYLPGKPEPVKILPTSHRIDPQLLRSMMNFGFFIMIAGLFGMVNQNSDVNFIVRIWDEGIYHGQRMSGEEMAGIYSANKKLAVLILLVVQAFRFAAEPFYFKQADKENARANFARVFHFFMMATIVVFLLIASFAKEIVSFRVLGFTLIDETYWDGLDVIPLVLAGNVLFAAYSNLSIWFKLTKQVRFGLFFAMAGMLALVIFNLALIPLFGYMGAAVSMLISFGIQTVLVYLMGQKYYPIPYRLGRLALYAGIVLIAFWINARIGEGYIGDRIFFEKLGVSALALAAIVLLEKFFPLRWVEPVAAKVQPQKPEKKEKGVQEAEAEKNTGSSRKENRMRPTDTNPETPEE